MREKGESFPSFDFLVNLKDEYPEKPLLLSYSGDKTGLQDWKSILEPNGIPTFPEIEQPFQALSVLTKCYKAKNRISS